MRAFHIKNLTQNAGLVPINLGPARLQRNDYTIVHFYDLNPLLREFENLNIQHKELQYNLQNKSTNFSLELVNYNKIIVHIKTIIIDKISNIQLGQPNNRKKRGLYNRIGTVIKTVTGNLDAEDGDRLNKIIESLSQRGTKLQTQVDLQYSLNQQAIQKFEDRIRNIEHNEYTLRAKINHLSFIVETEQSRLQNMLYAKELFNQLILLYNSILSVLQDVENSITFCSINTFHPSIIKPQELLAELEKLNKEYKHQTAFKLRNLPKLQKIMDVRCRIENMRIMYFLSFPVNFETKFDLYLLLAIPSYLQNEYRTIIPNTKYLLKSDAIIKSLNNPCVSSDPFQCFQKDVNNNVNKCEVDVLQSESTKNCQYISLEIKDSYMELIPEINQYLGVFPQKEVLKFESESEVEIKELQGIFLIEPVKGSLYFKNQKLHFFSESYGKPTLITNINFDSHADVLSNIKLKVHNMKLNEINLNQFSPDSMVDNTDNKIEHYFFLSLTCTLSLILFLIFIAFAINYYVFPVFCKKNVTKLSRYSHVSLDKIENDQQRNVLPDKAIF